MSASESQGVALERLRKEFVQKASRRHRDRYIEEAIVDAAHGAGPADKPRRAHPATHLVEQRGSDAGLGSAKAGRW